MSEGSVRRATTSFLTDSDVRSLSRTSRSMLRSVRDAIPGIEELPLNLVPNPENWTVTRVGPYHFRLFMEVSPSLPTDFDEYVRTMWEKTMRAGFVFAYEGNPSLWDAPITKDMGWLNGYNWDDLDVVQSRVVVPGNSVRPNVWWVKRHDDLHAVVAESAHSWDDAMLFDDEMLPGLPDLNVAADGTPSFAIVEWCQTSPENVWNENQPIMMMTQSPLRAASALYLPSSPNCVWIRSRERPHIIMGMPLRADTLSSDLVEEWVDRAFGTDLGTEPDVPGDDDTVLVFTEEQLDALDTDETLRFVLNDDEGSLNRAFVEWMSTNGHVAVCASYAEALDLDRFNDVPTCVIDFVFVGQNDVVVSSDVLLNRKL